ncbi:ribosomal-protein-alanine N-acetyltransferase [Alkalihalobacillus xiaoxiensis]|uniref:Ribosomal-protein-alanine N-acetyltransferase n=1 Tax=Shouchella xiaoxiensis TaxID=766895 RepID=A0ABS2SU91_9BACI|nr:GNAT family protein [Shouchella xiaoxiensis]MBM7837807.1 ribosomal-protein-alanine N-acetyltransferase [Shouchella xiaoxiensis]
MPKQPFFPQLETDRLRLRALTDDDAAFIFKLYSNEKVCAYLYDEEVYTSMDDAREFIEWHAEPEKKGRNRWGIERKTDGVLLGTCGFDSWDRYNQIAEIGYDLWPEYWGAGYMKEALVRAIDNGFSSMNLNRINAFVALENYSSFKLLEQLGFKKEGIMREKHLFRGVYYDHYSYSLLKREWRN